MLPGDRLVCAFTKPIEVGEQFKNWLLHVTIAPWFRLEDESSQIAGSLQTALSSIPNFEYHLGEKVTFGPRKNRPAYLVAEPEAFVRIEVKVRNYFHKKRAWLVDETTKKPRQFRPHITVQKDLLPVLDRPYNCDRLYIVEQKGEYKEVMAEIKLDEATA